MSQSLLHEIWNKRSLILLFALNDVKVRYRNSFLGFIWSFLEPLLMLTVLYFIFTNIIKSNVENYPLYLLLGLIVWYMFQRSTTMGASSLLDKASIIQKVYFRRELVVISSSLTAFIMMGFEFIAFSFFLVIFKFVPPVTSLLLPFLLIDLFFLCVGVSLLLSILTVYFRDIKFIWQILLQVGFFVTPIIYQLNMFPESVRYVLQFNPLVSILDSAHYLVLYGSFPSLKTSLYIVISTSIIFILGYAVFKAKNKKLIEAL